MFLHILQKVTDYHSILNLTRFPARNTLKPHKVSLRSKATVNGESEASKKAQSYFHEFLK